MNTGLKLGAYALLLAVVGAAAVGLGNAVGPVGTTAHETSPTDRPSREPSDGHVHRAGPKSPAPATLASGEKSAGLTVSQRGFTLDLVDSVLPAGAESLVRFRILGPDQRPLRSYERSHGKALHLIAVRRDMVGFQHVHPTLDRQGTWRTRLDLSQAGEYRLFADFAPARLGDSITLGADLSVAGSYAPEPLPAPSRTAEVQGYRVRLDGRLVPGQQSRLTLSVSKGGQPVTDLQPYLGAYGHLVALRDGDLSYLHVHPAGEPADARTATGPSITFTTTPSAGQYRLFLDFRHEGVVRTAEFTAAARPTADEAGSDTPAPPVHGSHGH